MTLQPQPQAGWYPDPAGAAGLRYFDGNIWTEHYAPRPQMVCPRCHSTNITMQVVANTHTQDNMGVLRWILLIVLALFTLGIVLLLVPLVRRRTVTTMNRVAICQSCGYTW